MNLDPSSHFGAPQTPAEIAAYREQVEIAIEKREADERLKEESIFLMQNFKEFIKHAWNELEPLNVFMSNWHIDAICEHLQAISESKIRRLSVWVPPGSMKPVDENALVLMGDGERKKLVDVRVGDFVISHTGRPREVLAVHEQGLLETVRIETESGRVTHAAPDHPFLTSMGWKDAGELIVGDVLGTVAMSACRGESERSLEEMRLIGYFIGDGNCTINRSSGLAANVTCFDPIQGEDIVKCAKAMGFGTHYSTNPNARRWEFSKGVRPWLRETGLAGHGSWTKRVPDFVFSSPLEHIEHFIAAYFTCDGTLTNRSGEGKQRSDLSVIFNSVNRPLLQDVQHLLLRLGVRSKIRMHKGNGFKGPDYVSWRLVISSLDDTSKFISRIPVIGEKAERLATWGIRRTRFDEMLLPDAVISVEDAGLRKCRCLTVSTDATFTADDLVVRNSRLVSVLWPAWEWTHSPGLKYWTGSYDIHLAMEMASYSRDLMQSDWYQERWAHEFKFRSTAAKWLTNDQGGHRLSTSPESSGTGKHGHRIIIDDAVNALDASATTRAVLEKANEWYSTSLAGRGLPGYAEVIVMQRLHERDFAANALSFADWEVLCLPEVYEENHPFAWRGTRTDLPPSQGSTFGSGDPRQEGELLWPARRDWEEHKIMSAKLGKNKAAGQLQQRPAAREGTILARSNWRYFPAEAIDAAENGNVSKLPAFRSIVISWDTTFKGKNTSDYVAGGIWGIHGADRYLLRVFHQQASLSVTKRAMLEMRQWALKRWPRVPIRVVIEKSANGVEIGQQLKSEITGVHMEPVSTDKTERAIACEPDFESHNVHVPGKANVSFDDYDPASTPPWVQDVIEQCSILGHGAHDDLVDMVTLGLNYARTRVRSPTRTASALRGRSVRRTVLDRRR